MVEQRYRAMLAVIGNGLTVTEVARAVGVSRQTLHSWLARYEAEGLAGLEDRSHRPRSCPPKTRETLDAAVEYGHLTALDATRLIAAEA